MSLAPGTRLGPYEILAKIGAGGMGEVYRARDARLGRDVAIKVLPASFSADPDRLRRFEQEARAAGILNHPNITAVLDIGEHEGAPYVVQELLEGETLRQALAGGLSPRKAIDHAIQIAHGLAAAHEKGIVHRDLKPENVFVTKDGRVKILDFGLAKLTHLEESSQATNLPTATVGTEPGMVLGTLGYMSPEQVRGRPADARSDIFSFGAILYEMLAGQRAFKGDSAADTMSAILKEDPADLSVTNQNIAPGVERIVRWPVAFSADGKTLLFCEDSPSAGAYYSTCVRGTDGSPTVRLGDGTGSDITADGKFALAVIPTNPDRLVIYPTGAGQTRTIPSGGIVTYESARFFPGGSRILLCGHESGRGVRCYVQGIEDPKPRPVTPEGTSNGFVSPDGRQIVVGSPRGLEVLPSEGGNGKFIPGTEDDTVVRWTPDGKALLVGRSWEVPRSISKLDVATGRREPFRTFGPPDLTGALAIIPIAISDDMKVYGYATRRMHSHLFLVDGAR